MQIKQKYDYLSLEEINACYNLALSDLVRLTYPSSNNRPSIDKFDIDFYASQWIYARMLDILDRAGGTSVTAYKENGISFTYAASYIDPSLVAQIMPKASVPK
ncbi:MAG: hypothetical protein IKB02_05605 [Clostridia bacterium]|nr:hypothetical protein [Clostridia bacterium]